MRMNRIRAAVGMTALGALAIATVAPVAQAQDPITMQMWGRNVDEVVYNALIEEWNASHANQIELTIIPSADYVARVAAAASAGELPDLLDVDLIYMPDFINQGLFQPITDQVNGYANKDALSPGHVAVSTTADGQIYGVPFYVDASSLFWNKDLYAAAGLDPEKGPTTWQQVMDDAAAIRALRHTPSGAFGSCRYKLKGLEENRAQYERLIEVFKAHNIGYFFYNGGNDSADTAYKVSQISGALGYPVVCVGIPKTVDNDLVVTDCCPGFGSVAKYVATSIREAGFDVASMARTSTKEIGRAHV